MKYNELPEKCKDCCYLKAWALYMDGNHEYCCKKHLSKFAFKDDCKDYLPEEECYEVRPEWG